MKALRSGIVVCSARGLASDRKQGFMVKSIEANEPSFKDFLAIYDTLNPEHQLELVSLMRKLAGRRQEQTRPSNYNIQEPADQPDY